MDARRLLGINVRTLRLARHLSQEELAARIGVGQYYISGLENGERNPTLSTIALLADALSVTLSELVAHEATGKKVTSARRPRKSNTKI